MSLAKIYSGAVAVASQGFVERMRKTTKNRLRVDLEEAAGGVGGWVQKETHPDSFSPLF